MSTAKYTQLTEIHLRHRIWRNELEGIHQEIYFWEDLLYALSEGIHSDLNAADTWTNEIAQLHDFRLVVQNLLKTVQLASIQVSVEARTTHVLDVVTQLDHQHLRAKIDHFQADFQLFKTHMRQFMLTPPTL